MRIFVSGATGVIGRRVVPQLVANGHNITALARDASKRARLAQGGVSAIDVSIFDRDALTRAMQDHDVVVNLATHIPKSTFRMMLPGAWNENDDVRRRGAAAIADAATAAGVGRLLQESFAPIYADAGESWIDETSPVNPVPYNRSVLDAEASVARFSSAGGIGIVLRFAAFYGPDAFHVKDMVASIRAGWAPLPGDPRAYWSSVHHDDAATAVIAALAASAGTYNVVDDKPLRRQEFFAAIADAYSLKHPRQLPRFLMKLMGSKGELLGRSHRMSNGKLRRETGWAPTYPSAREGFRAIATAQPLSARQAPASPTVNINQ